MVTYDIQQSLRNNDFSRTNLQIWRTGTAGTGNWELTTRTDELSSLIQRPWRILITRMRRPCLSRRSAPMKVWFLRLRHVTHVFQAYLLVFPPWLLDLLEDEDPDVQVCFHAVRCCLVGDVSFPCWLGNGVEGYRLGASTYQFYRRIEAREIRQTRGKLWYRFAFCRVDPQTQNVYHRRNYVCVKTRSVESNFHLPSVPLWKS